MAMLIATIAIISTFMVLVLAVEWISFVQDVPVKGLKAKWNWLQPKM